MRRARDPGRAWLFSSVLAAAWLLASDTGRRRRRRRMDREPDVALGTQAALAMSPAGAAGRYLPAILGGMLGSAAVSLAVRRRQRRVVRDVEARWADVQDLSQRLEQSEARFRGAFEQAAVGMAHTGLDGAWRMVNARFAQLLGYPSQEAMIGRLVTEVTPPEELRKDIASARRLMSGGMGSVTREKRYVRPDGSDFWASVTLSLLRDPATGEPEGFMVVVQDITAERRTRRALEERDAYLRQLVDSTFEGLVAFDTEGRCTLVNQAALDLLGYRDAGELVGGSLHDAVHHARGDGSPYPVHECPVQRLLTGKSETVHLEDEVLWRRDGTPLEAEYRGRVIHEEGRVVGAVVTFSDISDRKRAVQEREELLASERVARSDAERANRIKEQFVAMVSHELRTPLSSILGWTQILLRRSDELPPRVTEGLRVVERNARLQAQLVSDLLDVSRILSGRFRVERELFELAGVVARVAEGMRPEIEARDERLVVRVSDEVGQMEGDPQRIQQVLSNLLSNAMKFNVAGGTIDVALERRGDEAVLRVCDEGQGIAPKFLPYIFDRFRQEDPSITRAAGGLGLGLAIVKEIVDRHGGQVVAESEGVGRGATFVVRLPLATTERGTPREPSVVAPARLDGLHILVVEDDPDTRAMLETALEEQGGEVVSVECAADAEVAFDRQLPDVLVSDIGLPRRDGYDLIRSIRERKPQVGGLVPAVALTAMARPEDRARALSAGYQAHVAKPVNLQALVRLIAALAEVPA